MKNIIFDEQNKNKKKLIEIIFYRILNKRCRFINLCNDKIISYF